MLPTIYTPEKLRELRHRALLTQEDVTRATGLSRQSLTHLERGHKRPRYSTLSRLLTLYGICIRTNEQRERTWETGEEQTGAPPVAQAVGPQRAGGILPSPATTGWTTPTFYRRSGRLSFVRKAH
jgi:transcriptional regulator with XRE-family HTH domain